jgi:YVTN family beta-propeller protein
VAVVDTERMSVVDHLSTGGERPTGLALVPDGSRLLVTNSFSGTVALVPTSGGPPVLVRLPGMPYGVVIAPDGKRAFVTVSQLDEVAALDLASRTVTARVSVGRRPRALDLSSDGKTLAVGNMAGGSISVVNTESLWEESRIPLKGVNVRGVAFTSSGAEVYATLMPPLNGSPTADPKEIWHNLLQSVSVGGVDGEDQWTDFARLPGAVEVVGSPDQHDIVLDRTGRRAWISVAGRDVITRISIHDSRRATVWPLSQVETGVGANPRGLALSPDGKQVWVANHLGNSLSVVDAESTALVKTIDLGNASRVDASIRGQYLFNNAGLTRGRRFTCSSCHPDGGTDGLTWSFAHVRDGFQRRNTRDLRAGIEETAPFRWSGVEAHLSDLVRSEVTGLLGSPTPAREDTEALVAAIRQFRLPPNPYREPDGQLTPQARQGETLFEGKAGCVECHAGPKRGGTSLKAWIGTTSEGQEVDVPHLAGVYDSAPYLHDGRAATLEEIWEKHNGGRRHGAAHLLTAEEFAALMRYLREL